VPDSFSLSWDMVLLCSSNWDLTWDSPATAFGCWDYRHVLSCLVRRLFWSTLLWGLIYLLEICSSWWSVSSGYLPICWLDDFFVVKFIKFFMDTDFFFEAEAHYIAKAVLKLTTKPSLSSWTSHLLVPSPGIHYAYQSSLKWIPGKDFVSFCRFSLLTVDFFLDPILKNIHSKKYCWSDKRHMPWVQILVLQKNKILIHLWELDLVSILCMWLSSFPSTIFWETVLNVYCWHLHWELSGWRCFDLFLSPLLCFIGLKCYYGSVVCFEVRCYDDSWSTFIV
jgi:hypothetical protein